jgi:hypothetical protein
MQVDHNTDNSLYAGCQLRRPIAADATISFDAAGTAAPFYGHFYQIDAIKSGCHHPDGALWLKTGAHQVHAEKVSILDILPTLLDLLGIDDRRFQAHPYRGASLLPRWRMAA